MNKIDIDKLVKARLVLLKKMEGTIWSDCEEGTIKVKIEGNSIKRKGKKLSFDSFPNCAYCEVCGMVWG